MARFLGDARPIGRDSASSRYETPEGTVELAFCTPRIGRLRLVDEREWPSYVGPRDWSGADLRVEGSGGGEVVRTGQMTAWVSLAPFRVTFGDAAGNVLIRQGGVAGIGVGTGATTGPGGFAVATTTHGYPP